MTESDMEARVDELEERVAELETVINRELGYNLGSVDLEPQICDCDCGESFEVNIVNGLICLHCGRGSEDRGEAGD